MTKSKIYPAVVLGSICLVVAILLSGINMITAPEIAKRAEALAAGAKAEVLPGASGFKDITNDFDFPASITEAHSADIGFVFRASSNGRNGEIVIMVGVSNDGKITGTKIITESESKGYKEKVFTAVEGTEGQYTGQTLDDFSPVIMSGSTMTSNGVANAIKAALQAYTIASGGSVDLRTPEQILQDNCNAALGTEGKTFTKWFATEVLVGVEKVYVCDAGLVMVIGDKYVGVNNEGAAVNTTLADGTTTAVSGEDSSIVTAAYGLYSATSLTQVDRPEGAGKRVTKIEVTATGNYVFYMKAAGNGINGEEWSHPSGDYIEFMVCISSDGKIVDVKTTYQSESKGYGDVCETDEYTEQFKGATSDKIVITPDGESKNSTDLGIISGSTITSNGYQKALQQAFTAFELLTASEGGNN